MEDNTTYTYRYEKEQEKPARSLKKYFAVVIVVLLVAAVVCGIVAGKVKAENEAETTTAPVTTAEPLPTEPPVDDTYKPGSYSVNTGDVALRFRKDHSQDAEAILEIADKTKLEITEIYIDENATDEVFKYWGKTKFLGHEGWITMKYLKKEYSDNIVTPDDFTDAVTESATAAGVTTADTTVPNVTKPAAESVTAGNSGTATSKYSAGDYKVATGGSTLRFKKKPGRNTDVLASIPDGTAVAVLEVIEINETDDIYRYWGKISYNGHIGYVSMAYLAK